MCDLILCPACGSDRLIPLSFGPPWRNDRFLGQPEADLRPVIKCIRCGERSYVSIKVHKALSER
jgi:hypothetical protein